MTPSSDRAGLRLWLRRAASARDACTHFGGTFVADDIFAPLDTADFTYMEQIADGGARLDHDLGGRRLHPMFSGRSSACWMTWAWKRPSSTTAPWRRSSAPWLTRWKARPAASSISSRRLTTRQRLAGGADPVPLRRAAGPVRRRWHEQFVGGRRRWRRAAATPAARP